ncbi:MAG: Hsp70 family protein [Planctomycetales bacterium]|nr:Hsp70 family protein [Planctomycetales bacterium]
MQNVHPIGIDLGTTNSAVAYVAASGRTEMLRNSRNEVLTPSVVLFDQDAIVVGAEARKACAFRLAEVAAYAKREMGKEFYSRPVAGHQLPPEVIQAYVLKQLRQDIEDRLTGPYEVVITVPAFFDAGRRQKTLDAGELAGLQVLDIVNEPTAAALAFGEQLGYVSPAGAPSAEMNLLVYDLGGGTFDVTVIHLAPHGIRTLATDGDVLLGGCDWDRRLVDYVSQKFEDRYRLDPRNDPNATARLVQLCEDAKHTLSVRRQATVLATHAGRQLAVDISRETFQDLTADLVERTLYTSRQVLAAANLTWNDIHRVLLVGGSTRMPMIADHLREESAIEPDNSMNPDEAVARGAAIFATERLRTKGVTTPDLCLNVVDVNSHSLGVAGINQMTGRRENTILIPKNQPLPAHVSQQFVTKHDNQQSIVIKVLEGESSDPAACIVVGKAVLRNLPPGLRKGHPIEVAYEYATDGRLTVRGRVVHTNHQVMVEFQRDGRMGDRRFRDWRQVVQRADTLGQMVSMLAHVVTRDNG